MGGTQNTEAKDFAFRTKSGSFGRRSRGEL